MYTRRHSGCRAILSVGPRVNKQAIDCTRAVAAHRSSIDSALLFGGHVYGLAYPRLCSSSRDLNTTQQTNFYVIRLTRHTSSASLTNCN